eukprot:855123-Prorocentrum_minimum.AAC.1
MARTALEQIGQEEAAAESDRIRHLETKVASLAGELAKANQATAAAKSSAATAVKQMEAAHSERQKVERELIAAREKVRGNNNTEVVIVMVYDRQVEESGELDTG